MKLFVNMFQLFIWQGSTYLVPLIVTPYLTRVLGLHAYGVFGFAWAISAYCILFADWGFNLSATQKVARASDDGDMLRRLFWGTLLAKVMLATASLCGLIIVILLVPQLRDIWPALLASSLGVVATAFSANFFLQGLQFMGSFAASALFGRLLTIPLMLLLVHGPDDVWLAAAIQGGTQFVSAIASLVVSARLARLFPVELDFRFALRQIQDGWHQFLSNLSVSFYTQANTVIVGLLAGPVQAGLLTGSQRISQAFQGLVIPINMAVYPQVNRLMERDQSGAARLMFQVLVGQAGFALLLSLAMWIIAPYAVPFFLGAHFVPAVEIVQTLALLPFLMGVSNVFGNTMLLPLGMKTPYTASLMTAGIVNVLFLLVLAPRLGAIGGAISAVVTEAFLCMAMGGVLYVERAVFGRMRQGERS
jgi:PST family polysaccharide transporter